MESTDVGVDITASRAVSMSLFINGHYVGSASDFNHPLEDPIALRINGTVLLDSLNLVRPHPLRLMILNFLAWFHPRCPLYICAKACRRI